MPITIDSYDELPQSPVEVREQGKLTATRELSCDWGDRYDVMNFLFGWENRAYPYDTNAYAEAISIKPFPDTPPAPEGAGIDRVVYEKAQLSVTYKTMEGNVKDGTAAPGNVTGMDFCSENLGTETQFLNLTANDVWWDAGKADALPDGQMPQKIIPYIAYNVTFHNIKNVHASLFSLVGSVNSGGYESTYLDETFGAEKLLYARINLTRSITTFGTAGWDVALTFMYHEASTWQHVWNPDTQAWSRIYDGGGAEIDLFEVASFSDVEIPVTPS